MWKNGKNKFAKSLLNNIKEISTLNINNKLQFTAAFGSISPFDLLAECLNVEYIFGDVEIFLEKLIYDVIVQLLLSKKDINVQSFENEFNSIKSKPMYRDRISYQFVVEAFVDSSKNQKLMFNDCEIRLLTKKFPRGTLSSEISSELGNTVFEVHCSSPSSQMSYSKAIEAVNFTRALWHFCSPTRWQLEVAESLFKPFSTIGISNNCFYRTGSDDIQKKQMVNYIKNKKLHKLDLNTINVSRKILKLINRIKEYNPTYYNLLKNSLIQNVKSIDSMDLTNSLPLLWGAI